MSGAAEGTLTAPDAAPHSRLFAEALELLEHEKPDARANRLFDVLNWLVSGALALTVLYAVLRLAGLIDHDWGLLLAWTATALYLSIIPACGLNVRLVRQLHRVATLQRRWMPVWRQQVKKGLHSQIDRPPIAGFALLLFVGAVFILGGIFFLVLELTGDQDWRGVLLATVAMAFGASFVIFYYVSQGRRRLRVFADLRASLEAGQTAAYDVMAEFSRTLLDDDRRRTVKADARAKRVTYRESSDVRKAKQAQDAPALMCVLTHVARLVTNPPPAQTGVQYDKVEGTHLELGYTVSPAAQVTLLSLAREGERPPVSQEDWSDEATHRVSYWPSASAAIEKLPPEHRIAVDATISDLLANPARYSHLATPTKEGLELPVAHSPVKITYDVDGASRTVSIKHVKSTLRARRILFVSYSHKDEPVYTQVMRYVGQLEKQGLVEIWSDKQIRPGDRWDEEIKGRLETAKSALLLVSQEFVRSGYIISNELPYLLERAARENNRIRLFWVAVTQTTLEEDWPQLKKIQSLIPPDPPLEQLEAESKARLNKALKEIYEALREALLREDEVERLV